MLKRYIKLISIVLIIVIIFLGVVVAKNNTTIKIGVKEEKKEKSIENYLEVGDYVDYDPTKLDPNKEQDVTASKLTYTSPIGTVPTSSTGIITHGNGYASQTFTAKPNNGTAKGIRWRVLSISENGIELISEEPIKTDNNVNFSLRGGTGYLYAEQELHNICSIYGYGYGANTSIETNYTIGGPADTTSGKITGTGARSITIEDINKVAGITQADFTTLNPDYGKTINITTPIYYPTLKSTNTTSPGQSSGKRSSFINNYYLYNSSRIENEEIRNMLTNGNFWIASRYIPFTTGSSSKTFCVRQSWSEIWASDTICLGNEDALTKHTGTNSIRPIVTIDPNVINVSNATPDSGTQLNPWRLKESNTVTYKVEHYLKNIGSETYKLEETENKDGAIGDIVTAVAKKYPGFTENTQHTGRVPNGTVTEDEILVLKLYYDRNTYKLTINIDGNIEEIEYVYGEEITLPTDKIKDGYTFNGWYDNEELEGTAIEKVDTSTIDPEGEQPTYYIKWEINKYTVTFKDGEKEETQTVNHGSSAIAPNWTKPGYILTWDKDITNITGNITTNAVWIPNNNVTYKVEHYLENIGSETYKLQETETKFGIKETIVTAVAKKYPGFTENTQHAGRVPSGTVTEDEILVLKLYYDRNTYKLTINIDGNIEEIEYVYGEEITLPTDKIKDGYTFNGWYDNEELEGTAIEKVDTSTIDPEGEQPTYYIKWEINKYTVTFKDGEKEETQTVNHGSSAIAPNWTKPGYTLTWDKDITNITEDTTVNAIWKEEGYYITSPVYNINTQENYITKVSPYTDLTTFLNNIETNGIPKVVDLNGKEITDKDLVGTGYKLQVTYKDRVYEYDIAVRGDLDGNGEITVTDLSILNKVMVEKLTLTGMKEKAADIDYNNNITITDLSMLNQALVGKISL